MFKKLVAYFFTAQILCSFDFLRQYDLIVYDIAQKFSKTAIVQPVLIGMFNSRIFPLIQDVFCNNSLNNFYYYPGQADIDSFTNFVEEVDVKDISGAEKIYVFAKKYINNICYNQKKLKTTALFETEEMSEFLKRIFLVIFSFEVVKLTGFIRLQESLQAGSCGTAFKDQAKKISEMRDAYLRLFDPDSSFVLILENILSYTKID